MTEDSKLRVDGFILEQIDTVPHLEALLLLWNKRPRQWSCEEMADALYLRKELAERILRDLVQRNLAIECPSTSGYIYNSNAERDALLTQVDLTYRRELIRLTRMIHAKAPTAMREFARAFRFTRDKERE
ncbi:MAG TPA: hypothetical protein VFA89_04135 [Terriglobales bacterium]|nr:hypothetical protein [Terriglobales bacterium]